MSYILVSAYCHIHSKVYFWNGNFIDSCIRALVYHLYKTSSCGNSSCLRVLRLFCSTGKLSSALTTHTSCKALRSVMIPSR